MTLHDFRDVCHCDILRGHQRHVVVILCIIVLGRRLLIPRQIQPIRASPVPRRLNLRNISTNHRFPTQRLPHSLQIPSLTYQRLNANIPS